MRRLLVLLALGLALGCTNSPTAPDPLDVATTPLATQASHESLSFGGRPVMAKLTGPRSPARRLLLVHANAT